VMINGSGFENGNTLLMFIVLLCFCGISLLAGIGLMNRAVARAEQGNGVGIVV
jgi:hypothetical protein